MLHAVTYVLFENAIGLVKLYALVAGALNLSRAQEWVVTTKLGSSDARPTATTTATTTTGAIAGASAKGAGGAGDSHLSKSVLPSSLPPPHHNKDNKDSNNMHMDKSSIAIIPNNSSSAHPPAAHAAPAATARTFTFYLAE